jgi:hypothetical protein
MKRMVFTIAALALAVSLLGQGNPVDEFFNKFSDKKGYTTVVINGNLLGFLDNRDDEFTDNPIRKVTSIRLVVREKDESPGNEPLLPDIRNIIRRGRYEELMSVRNDGNDLRFMVRIDGEIVREILLVIDGDDEAVIQIEGSLTRDEASRLVQTNGKGLAILEGLETSGK